MPAATPSHSMILSAALAKRGFQTTGSGTTISPNGTVFASHAEAWAYVQEVEAGAARLHALWRAASQVPPPGPSSPS